jgi:hypothetical protein
VYKKMRAPKKPEIITTPSDTRQNSSRGEVPLY